MGPLREHFVYQEKHIFLISLAFIPWSTQISIHVNASFFLKRWAKRWTKDFSGPFPSTNVLGIIKKSWAKISSKKHMCSTRSKSQIIHSCMQLRIGWKERWNENCNIAQWLADEDMSPKFISVAQLNLVLYHQTDRADHKKAWYTHWICSFNQKF